MPQQKEKSNVTFREQRPLAFSFAHYTVTFSVMNYIVIIVLFLDFQISFMFLPTTVEGATLLSSYKNT